VCATIKSRHGDKESVDVGGTPARKGLTAGIYSGAAIHGYHQPPLACGVQRRSVALERHSDYFI